MRRLFDRAKTADTPPSCSEISDAPAGTRSRNGPATVPTMMSARWPRARNSRASVSNRRCDPPPCSPERTNATCKISLRDELQIVERRGGRIGRLVVAAADHYEHLLGLR